MGILKNDRLIPAGQPCPFAFRCKYAADKTCNRPAAMANDFSCGTARAFALVGTGISAAQFHVTYGSREGSYDNKTCGAKGDISAFITFLNEAPTTVEKKPGPPAREKPIKAER